MESLFDKGYQLCEDSMFDEAVKVYEEIMERADEGSTEYGKAMYNSGYAYLAEGKIKEARKTFLDILDADYDEMDRGGRGSGLMAEPYALYKHDACENLAAMELNAGHFRSAYEYVRMFDKVFPYHHFCGNEWEAYYIYRAEMYAKAYCGMDDTTTALIYLFPHIFNTGLASNEHLLQYTVSILLQQYDRSVLINDFKAAVENMSFIKRSERKYARDHYIINFLNLRIDVPSGYSPGTEETKGKTELELRKMAAMSSDFFKELNK